ncbi:hypothetical protein VAR608DRAFT_4924 [Variovorax sp. HW608]|uniref:hypothetical protein n=1 Tax=Variovorax sp. HW608 TaxID=1034889 RepID=UPI00081FB31B|nr:hypothetical protein [Variovorax sp. HW608]SCK49434.1 hypothetical protein VAR608DRAFT_4924 [Variovorax sp. HW608]
MTEPLTLTDQERVEHVARMMRELLTEHRLAGCFFLSAPTHCADAIMFDTAPWLRLKLETDDEGVTIGARMRSKLDEYRARGLAEAEARAAQGADISATINTLDFLAVHMAQFSMVVLQLASQTQQHFGSVTTSERVGDAWGRKPS